MFALEFLPARHGDCILVRWDTPQRVMVVDGGPTGIYEEVLRPRLMDLQHSRTGVPTVDVMCVSHVDDDHIVGVDRLLRELVRANADRLPLPITVRAAWFNSVDDLIDGVQPGLATAVRDLVDAAPPDEAVVASFTQGRDVRSSVAALSLAGNQPFGDVLTTGLTTRLNNLDITVVAPSTAAIKKLASKWRASAKAKNTKAVGTAFTNRSVPNLSSIALHLRFGEQTALLTGDARGDHLIAGLESTGLLKRGEMLHVNAFKLPHHGSKNNSAPSLFERIRADHYVVSADGIKHDHPSTDTLKWLVGSRAPEDAYTIHLTHPVPKAQKSLSKLAQDRAFHVVIGVPRVEITLSDAD